MKHVILLSTTLLLIFTSSKVVLAQPTELPLLGIDALQYEGAFSIPGGDFGDSNANFASGIIAFNSTNNSLFLAGFDLHGALAEFSIPELVNSTDLMELNTASVLQNFKSVLGATPNGNPQSIDRISGMYMSDNKLVVNALEYYDAAANNSHTTLVIEDALNLETSAISGYFSITGSAHASGWISEIPQEWQSLLGDSHISGNSSKYPINGRLAMGISAFAFDVNDLFEPAAETISSTTLLDFDLTDPLYADFDTYDDANYNILELNGTTFPGHTVEDADIVVGENNLWTESSQASYGFIVPNTRTYLTIGASSGHNSGIGYKPQQNNGNLCGGPCPYDAEDSYNYYWLWDVNDLLAVKNGTTLPHSVRPYAYGVFEVPFQYDVYYEAPEHHEIVGGSFDAATNTLYLSVFDGASTGPYDKRPVIVAYSISQEVLIDGSVSWLSSCGSRPANLEFYQPGTTILAEQYDIIVDSLGQFQFEGAALGTFDVFLKVDGYLKKSIGTQTITASTSFSFLSITPGDLNGDNAINISDVSQFNLSFGKSVGDIDYNVLSDLNCDENIDILDISIFGASFGLIGDIAPLD